MAWWEDEAQNPNSGFFDQSRRKIIFEDRIRRRRASLESSVRSSSKGSSLGSRGQSPKTNNKETESDRILPSLLMRRWKKVGRILNIANTLARLRVQDR